MKQFKLYYTSDVHGYLLPTDYIQAGAQPLGLANAATHFQKDAQTLIIDGGDMFQGSPMLQYLQQQPAQDAVTTAMNLAGYDYVTLGNHDFNFGYDALQQHLARLDATVIAENVTDLNGHTLYPAQIKTLGDGTRIGLMGLVTDYINIWEQPAHLNGIKITAPLFQAQQTVAYLRAHADVVIGLYHGGYERDLATGQLLSDTTENMAWALTQALDLDILLTAHQHGDVQPQVINGVLTLQLPNQAKKFAVVTGQKHQDQWEFAAETKPVGDIARPDIVTALAPLQQQVEAWLDQPVATLNAPVPSATPLELAQFGHPILQWLAAVQLAASQADVTLVSLNNNPMSLPTNVTLRQILQNYPFDNTLVTKRVTGRALRASLEHTADYFILEGNGQLAINPAWLQPKVEHYNYDLVYGLQYTFDVTQPVGQRVTAMCFNGQAVQDEDTLTVAMNSYRAVGGGNYAAYQQAPTVFSDDRSVQELLTAYFKTHQQLPTAPKLAFNLKY